MQVGNDLLPFLHKFASEIEGPPSTLSEVSNS